MLFGSRLKSTMVAREDALPGRATRPYAVPATHAVLGTPLEGPWPEGTQVRTSRMGCFWGEEKKFWETPGVVTTAVGYQGGFTPNPTYEETCTGRTGHTETVLVAYDPKKITAEELLKDFWEAHDPTQGCGRATTSAPVPVRVVLDHGGAEAGVRGDPCRVPGGADQHRFGEITTERGPASEAGPFYYAEDYHQQYLHKVPNGYCGSAAPASAARSASSRPVTKAETPTDGTDGPSDRLSRPSSHPPSVMIDDGGTRVDDVDC